MAQNFSTSKEILKLMLEATNAKDINQPTPLDNIDPMTLDELMNRIDRDASLRQIPNPAQIAELVKFNIEERNKFIAGASIAFLTKRPRNKKIETPAEIENILDALTRSMNNPAEENGNE